MDNYKDRLYKNYYSSHILPRKGKASYNEFKRRSSIYQKQYGRFLPQDKTVKIIDIGCGNASVVWWLQQSGFLNAEGIDISPENVKIAQELGVKNIVQADFKDYLINKKGFYDIVFLRDVIEHFKKEEILRMLDIFYNSLNNKGGIIIQAPNAESPFFGRIRYGDFTHEIAFTSISLSQVLRVVGFKKIKVYPWEAPLFMSLKSLVRCVMWKMFEVFYNLLLSIEGYKKVIVTANIIAVAEK